MSSKAFELAALAVAARHDGGDDRADQDEKDHHACHGSRVRPAPRAPIPTAGDRAGYLARPPSRLADNLDRKDH
jgi:hypothetical protein